MACHAFKDKDFYNVCTEGATNFWFVGKLVIFVGKWKAFLRDDICIFLIEYINLRLNFPI